MNGRIDEFGRALLVIPLRATPDSPPQDLEVWVDTGFTGELVVPETLVKQLGLPPSAMVAAALADGSQSVLHTYSCVVEWFGELRAVEVIASQGITTLLGVGLLLGHRLIVDYARSALAIE